MATTVMYCNQCGASNPVQATHCFACSAALHAPTASPPSGPLVSSTSFLCAPVSVPANAIFTLTFNGPLAPSHLLHSRYSIVQQIGTGGFGAVYLAKDTLFSNRPVAIKEMNQDGLNPRELAEATAAFEREALLLAELTHPNLPRIHDHFSDNRSISSRLRGPYTGGTRDSLVARWHTHPLRWRRRHDTDMGCQRGGHARQHSRFC